MAAAVAAMQSQQQQAQQHSNSECGDLSPNTSGSEHTDLDSSSAGGFGDLNQLLAQAILQAGASQNNELSGNASGPNSPNVLSASGSVSFTFVAFLCFISNHCFLFILV